MLVITTAPELLRILDNNFTVLWFKTLEEAFAKTLMYQDKYPIVIIDYNEIVINNALHPKILKFRNQYKYTILLYTTMENIDLIPAFIYNDVILKPCNIKLLCNKIQHILYPEYTFSHHHPGIAEYILHNLYTIENTLVTIKSKIALYALKCISSEDINSIDLYQTLDKALTMCVEVGLRVSMFIHRDLFLNLINKYCLRIIYGVLFLILSQGTNNYFAMIPADDKLKLLIHNPTVINNNLNKFITQFLRDNNLIIVNETNEYNNVVFESYILFPMSYETINLNLDLKVFNNDNLDEIINDED